MSETTVPHTLRKRVRRGQEGPGRSLFQHGEISDALLENKLQNSVQCRVVHVGSVGKACFCLHDLHQYRDGNA